MGFIITILVSAGAFYLGAQLLSGVTINSYKQAIIVAFAVAALNTTLGFALTVMTFGVLSYGVFQLILSAFLIKVADYFLEGLKVENFFWALALAGTVAVINGVAGWVLF